VRVNKATQASGLLIHSIEARLVEMSRRAKAMWGLACFLSCVEALDGPSEPLGLLGRPIDVVVSPGSSEGCGMDELIQDLSTACDS
jgi:hypothetical protein